MAALQSSLAGDRQDESFRVPLVNTGIHSGPVNLTVQVLTARPEMSPSGWEDIHEVSLMLPSGRAFFNEPTGWDMKEVGTIRDGEGGSYRARIHSAGRDAAYDLVVESAVERHLVQFWKEAPSPVSVLSSRSEHGKGLPAVMSRWRATPAATSPDVPRLLPGY
jgi:hypothetical protein